MYNASGNSGDYRGIQVNASGQVILASGLYVTADIAESGIGVQVQSGLSVIVQSGIFVSSGLGVLISGQHVYVESGVYIASGSYVMTTQVAGVQSDVVLTNYTSNVLGVKFIDGKPRISSMPYTYDVAEGNISGHIPWSKLGFNGGIGTAQEDLISQGGTYVFPTSGIQMMLKSSEVGDRLTAPLGSGAWQVRVHYLDSGYMPQSEVVDCNGTSGVNTTAVDVIRIQNMHVESVGGNAAPLGNLILTDLSGTRTYGYIAAGQHRQRQCVWTVPASSTLYMTSLVISANTSQNKYSKFTVYTNHDDITGTIVSGFMFPCFEVFTVDSPFHYECAVPAKLIAKSDLKVSVVAEAAGTAACTLRGWYE